MCWIIIEQDVESRISDGLLCFLLSELRDITISSMF